MDKLFDTYGQLLEKRLDRYRLLNIGEDTIRYDFFAALMQSFDLEPHQIQLEVAINGQCFVPMKNTASKRGEKPLIDLVVNEDKIKLSAEFGLFRQNSNEDGTINQTARTVKMLNDMIRVSLESHFTGTKGYFICIADHKMLGHQMRSRIIERFPASYHINNPLIMHQLAQKTNNFDARFLNVFTAMDRGINSELVYNRLLQAAQIQLETRLLIWEVTLER